MSSKSLVKILRNKESLAFKVFKSEDDAIDSNSVKNQVIKKRHWATNIKNLMELLGFANAWTNQYEAIPNINVIRVRIRDQFMQHWCSHI